jgi:N-acetylmuramoyl-L-alanine amidase
MGSAKRQKYRDQWEKCIDRFNKAYRSDTRGPHAAESLYMIGLLYKGLAAESRRKADQDTAMDYFRRVKRDFPAVLSPAEPVRIDRSGLR